MQNAVSWTKKNPWILVLALLLGYYLYSQLFNALAQRHFDKHCENDAGEFIYKTVENPVSRYFCDSLFWASEPKQAAKT